MGLFMKYYNIYQVKAQIYFPLCENLGVKKNLVMQ